ncbi:MAG TPA: hypothetical protein VIT20_12010 [Propionibacteriaceae bacterium]
MIGTALRRRVRGARIWLVPVALVLLAVLVLWVAGGLRTVQATVGQRAEPEELISLARWDLLVHGVELGNRSDYDTAEPTKIKLRLRATFTGEKSVYGLGPQLVVVETLAGPAGIDPSPLTEGDRRGAFDPDVAREITLEFAWPDAPTPAPEILRVLIRDEEEQVNFLYPTAWAVGPGVDLHVDLPCDDRRTP